MNNRIITGALCFLMVVLFIAPVLTAPMRVDITTSNVAKNNTTAMQGPPVEMRINVIEDESVASNKADVNFDENEASGGIWVGLENTDGWARSWLKYDLSHLFNDISIISATLNLYSVEEWDPDTGGPIGIYYSANDSWSEESITWDDQPDFESTPADMIDAPLGENLIIAGNWYSFDVSDEVIMSYDADQLLTLVLKQVDETGTDETWKYFAEKDYSYTNSTYLLITYSAPEATGLTVEGFDSSPHTDYIQNATPTLEWEFLDSGTGSAQRDYELEVWDNEHFNDTLLYDDSRGDTYTVYDTSGSNNIRPFATDTEIRYQMKYEASMFSKGGVVDKLYFGVSEASGTAVFENLQINLVNHADSSDLTDDFDGNYEGMYVTNVLNRESYEAVVIDNWIIFDIENSFVLHGMRSLIIELRFTNNTGEQFNSPVTHSTPGTASVSYTVGVDSYYSQTADWLYNRTHQLKLEFASIPVMEFDDSTGNHFPFDTDEGHDGRYQQMYNKSLISETGLIDTLYFPATVMNEAVFENLLVRMAETTHAGELNHTHMDSNYEGATPTIVIDSAEYVVHNHGRIGVLKLETPFLFTGENNLLIDIQWENLTSGGFLVHRGTTEGGYRAYNLTYISANYVNHDDIGLDLHLAFVKSETQAIYDGTALTNATEYFWRVRVCDGTGVWSDWTIQSFKYEVLTSVPEWSDIVFDPDPGTANHEVDISLDVTHLLGINQVILEIDGTNYSMTASGDIYSTTWTPTESGNFTYTIYMESSIGTWSNTTGVYEVQAGGLIPGLPIDNQTLLLIAIGVLVLIIIVLALRRRK